jgi:nicotinamidase-related amidase
MKKGIAFAILLCLLAVVTPAKRIINGVEMLTEPNELVNPDTTAVLVIDMQNENCSTEGGCGRADRSIPADPVRHKVRPEYAEQVENTEKFLAAARKAGVLISYAEHIHANRYGAPLVTGPDLWVHRNSPWVSSAVEGTWEAQTIRELAPRPGDLVVHKINGNGFHGTGLGELYKERGVKSVLLAGTATQGCVFRTANGALTRGYYPVFVRDCVDHQDEKFVKWVSGPFPMYGSDEIIDIWENHEGQLVE